MIGVKGSMWRVRSPGRSMAGSDSVYVKCNEASTPEGDINQIYKLLHSTLVTDQSGLSRTNTFIIVDLMKNWSIVISRYITS